MTKRNLAGLMEWLRPSGIGLAIFLAYALGGDAVAQFHILGPWVVVVMCGTVAFEALVLGEAASEKIGYGIPTFVYKKTNLIHFAGYAKHIGIYPGADGIEAFKDRIQDYVHAKGSVQFRNVDR